MEIGYYKIPEKNKTPHELDRNCLDVPVNSNKRYHSSKIIAPYYSLALGANNTKYKKANTLMK